MGQNLTDIGQFSEVDLHDLVGTGWDGARRVELGHVELDAVGVDTRHVGAEAHEADGAHRQRRVVRRDAKLT